MKFKIGDRVICNCGSCDDLIGTITHLRYLANNLPNTEWQYVVRWDNQDEDEEDIKEKFLKLIKRKNNHNHPHTNLFK